MSFRHTAKGVSLKQLMKAYNMSKKDLEEIKMLVKKHNKKTPVAK